MRATTKLEKPVAGESFRQGPARGEWVHIR